jgi:hypothetical protein
MKVFSIFRKNLKGVARSWPYFAVLFVCPVLLILISGVVMNSVDFDNIRVGVIGSPEFDVSGIQNVYYYDSIGDCLFDLTNSRATVCIDSRGDENGESLDIYLDNSKKVVAFYAKQFILGSILDMQSEVIDRTSSEISSKVLLYSTSIAEARDEMVEVSAELEEQERLLLEYKQNLSVIRADFDSVYYPLKSAEGDIADIQADLHRSQEALDNVGTARTRLNEIRGNLNLLSGFLSGVLGGSDFGYASGIIGDISSDVNEVDFVLAQIESTGVDPRLVGLVDNLALVMVQLDEIKRSLDALDRDLDDAIYRTRTSRARIDNFIIGLDDISLELDEFGSEVSSDGVSFNLKDAFDLPDDPVLLAFPLLISLIIMFTSLVLSNMFILKEINQSSYLREVVSPVGDVHFLIADYLGNLFFVAVQTVVLFLVGVWLFALPVSEISVFALAIFLVASTFIFIGMAIGYFVKHQSLSMLLTIFFVMVLMVLSDVLAPTILTGGFIRFVIDLNPFMILRGILDDSIVFDRAFKDVFAPFFKLVIFFVVSFVFAYVGKKLSKRKL